LLPSDFHYDLHEYGICLSLLRIYHEKNPKRRNLPSHNGDFTLPKPSLYQLNIKRLYTS
jgi:hypothetical protein